MTGKARTLLEEGIHAFLASDFRQALQAWQQAFQLFVAANHAEGIQLASENLGGAHYHLGNYTEVVRFAEVSLDVSRKRRDHDGVSRALTLLGGAYAKLGDAEKAVAAHEESLRLCRAIDDQEGIIRATGNVAEALMMCGRYSEALERIQAALRLLTGRNIIHDRFYVRGENLLGAIYRNIGEHELADQAFDRALARARDADDRHGESAALLNRSIGYMRQKRWLDASEALKQAVTLKEEIGDRKGALVARINLAQCHVHTGDFESALTELATALESARSISHREGEWLAIATTALIRFKLGQLEEARHGFASALEIALEFGGDPDVATLQRSLARVLIALGHPEGAVPLLEESITRVEGIRQELGDGESFKISLFEDHTEAYQDLQWALAAIGQHERALEIAERGRTRALAESLARKAAMPVPAPDVAQMRTLAAELQTTFIVYSLVPDPRLRPRDELAFDLFTWAIPPDPDIPIAFHRSRGRWDAGVAALSYGTLMKPIEHALPEEEDSLLTFVPDSVLLIFPFAILPDDEGVPLVAKYAVSVTPSIHILQLSAERKEHTPSSNASSALIVGNPTMPDFPIVAGQPLLKPLPGTEEEAKKIAEKLKASPLIGHAATKPAVISAMPGAALLHFGTHGTFDPATRRKLTGALVLAADGDRDVLLTADEISRMNLRAKIAVLSACETGLGAVAAEGVLGLSRAFMTAGVPTVVASLWEVPDRATATLMKHFYDELLPLERRAHKARCLRQAMLRTMAEHPEPEGWAGFILIGDPR